MITGFLNIGHNFTNETQFIVVEWVKSTAQGTPVIGHVTGTGLGAQNDTDQTEVFYPAAHTEQTLQVTELPETWFLIRFWRSSDGVAKDVLLLTLAGNARTGAVGALSRYEYVVDRGQSEAGVWADPVEGDNKVNDTRLLGKTYWIEERGQGSFLDAELLVLPAGGFQFVDSAKTMFSGGVYVAYVLNLQDSDEDSGSTVIGVNEGIFILDADMDFAPLTMNNKTLIADFAALVGTLTIPNLGTLTDSRFRLQTHSGLQNNVVIQLDIGDTVRFRGEDVNSIILGKSEEIEILILDNTMYILTVDTGHFRLGQMLWSYMIILNTFAADGTSRVLAEWPRVEQLLDALPATSVVNEVTWQTSQVINGKTVYPNKGKWMRDGLNFRTPDLRDKSAKALSATDGSIASGRYEHENLLPHYHFIANDQDGGSPYLSSNHSTGGNLGYGFNGSNTIPDKYRTSTAGTGTDQIVNNTGFYPLICI